MNYKHEKTKLSLYKYFIILLLKIIIINTNTFAQVFDDNQKAKIQQNVLELLNQYTEYADLTVNANTISKDYINELKFLFINSTDAIIINPFSKTMNFISVNSYIKYIENHFPHGVEVKMNLDSIRFSKYKKISETTYSVHTICKHYTVGLSNSNKIHRKDILAHIIIEFNFDGNDFSDFKISQIKSNKLIQHTESNKQMKGIYLGVNTALNIGRFYLKSDDKNYIRKNEFTPSFQIGLSATYFINSGFGISTGVIYHNFKTSNTANYNNDTDQNISKTDADGDTYYLYVNSDLDEKSVFKKIEIPIQFIYRHGLYNKTNFYAKAGVNISYLLENTTTVLGNSTRSGYYPNLNLLVDDADFYGFGTIDYNNEYNYELNTLNFNGYLELGISIPLNKNSYLNTGISISRSLNNLKYKKSVYLDDYYTINGEAENAAFEYLGLCVNYIIKL